MFNSQCAKTMLTKLLLIGSILTKLLDLSKDYALWSIPSKDRSTIILKL